MAKEEQNIGQELMSWQIPEVPNYERGFWWYLLTSIISLAMIIYGFYTSNYLFVFIIVLFVVIAIARYLRPNEEVDVYITSEGILVDTTFHDYDTIKNFSVIYKPRQKIKSLYLEFNGFVRPRLTIPLVEANPIEVRENLLKYLEENLDRIDESNTDFFSKKLKI